MAKIIVGIHIGQAGVQVGVAMWELLLSEHGLSPTGLKCSTNCPDDKAQVMFYQCNGPKFMARAIFIDSDINTVARVGTGIHRDIFQPDYLLNTREESGGIYPRGYGIVANEIIEKVLRIIPRMLKDCDHPCGFLVTHSFGGGTGSGVSSKLLQVLKNEYPKSSQVEVVICPSQNIRSNNCLVVEPYNIGLFFKDTVSDVRTVILVDNEALFRAVHYRAGVKVPNYHTINRLLAHVLSALTAGSRFPSTQNLVFNDFETNLVPNGFLRFSIPSFCPIIKTDATCFESVTQEEITRELFEPRTQLFTVNTFDYPMVASCIVVRGSPTASAAKSILRSYIERKTVKFASWIPAAFKVGLVVEAPCFPSYAEIIRVPRDATRFTNSTALLRPWEKIENKFTMMLRKRSFLHWYTSAGLFYEDFLETREHLNDLLSHYTSSF